MEKLITLTFKEYEELIQYKHAFHNKKMIHTSLWGSFAISYTESETVEKLSEEIQKIKYEILKFGNLPWYKRIFYKF
jgi:hypothetical protein